MARRKVIDGQKRVMLDKKETFTIDAEDGTTTFIHKCCKCGLRHDVTIDMYENEADVTFEELD